MRVAVVGAGFVGGIHARAVASHPRATLVAVCGRTAPKTEALARAHGVAAYRSVGELLDRERLDVVCVATGNRDHAEPTLAALAAGAHVFVEKPLAFTLAEARAMRDAASAARRALGVNFNHRFSEPYRRALEFARAGALGTLAYVDVKFAGDLYKELPDPYCQLIETQGHSFDLMRLLGGEIATVSAHLADPRGIGVYTTAAVAVAFAGGAVGTLLGSWDGSYAQPHAQVVEAGGTDGRLVVDDVVGAVRLYRHGRGEHEVWRPGMFDARARDFWCTIDAHLHAFLDAVAAGAPPPVSGDDGVRALELTFAAIRSFERGQVLSGG